MQKPKIIVIVGPTASGKTSLSIQLAKKYDGEIISADSRQVYRGLDIGTGKVTKEEMDGIHHHLLDVTDTTSVFTASEFVAAGRTAIADILKRKKVPFIVGGTFFYVDALIGHISLPEVAPNTQLRSELDAQSTEELFTLLKERDARRASVIDPHNRRRLIRALEVNAELGAVPLPHSEPVYEALLLGIEISKENLKLNIHKRLNARLNAGMVNEVKQLHEGGLSYERMDALGLEYRYIGQYLEGKLSYNEMVRVLEAKIWQFAKRQLTWLKRDKEIIWVEKNNREEIEKKVESFLSLLPIK